MAGGGFKRVALILVAGCSVALVAPSAASATYPGSNGVIAYLRYAQHPNYLHLLHGIWAVNPDGTGKRRLVPGEVEDQAWSPNGRLLTYANIKRGRRGIYIANAAGSHRRRVTNGHDREPGFSPNGRRIVFVRHDLADRPTNSRAVISVRLDGSHPRVVLTGQRPVSSPEWSPSGRWIAYVGGGTGRWPSSSPTIFVIRPHGSGAHPIAAGLDPDWSPNGEQIACSRGEGIAILNVDGSTQETFEVTGVPTFSPDGRFIAYSSTSLNAISVDSGAINTIAPYPAPDPAWEPQQPGGPAR